MGTTSMNISRVRTGAILAVLGLLAGCGGGSSPVASGGNGAGGAGSANKKIGIVIVEETAQTLTLPAPIGTMTIIASGGQASFGFSAGGDNCPSTTSGDCQVFECAPQATTNSPPPT